MPKRPARPLKCGRVVGVRLLRQPQMADGIGGPSANRPGRPMADGLGRIARSDGRAVGTDDRSRPISVGRPPSFGRPWPIAAARWRTPSTAPPSSDGLAPPATDRTSSINRLAIGRFSTSRSTPEPSAHSALRTATTPPSLKFQQLPRLSSTSLCSLATRKLFRTFFFGHVNIAREV